jgi:hypothetical protein
MFEWLGDILKRCFIFGNINMMISLQLNLKVNIFAEILSVGELSKGIVRFYSVKLEDANETMFESFLQRCCSEQPISFETKALLETLKVIGRRGAKKHYFIHENKAHRICTQIRAGRKLRLYCYRLNEHTVILFGGAVKTEGARSAQACPNVGPYFLEAQKIAKALDNLILKKELEWSDLTHELITPNDFSF